MTAPDPEWLERMYNNRKLVPASGEYMARWAEKSADVRAAMPCVLDLRYGDGPNETVDVFPAARADAPVLVFLHGGYWRALDKNDHSFIAPAFTAEGACVVVPNYALCPGTPQQPVTVRHILLQMVAVLAWTWRHVGAYGGDRSRITVAGHSAGGHMAAAMLGCEWKKVAPDLPVRLVRNALSVSGVFDLTPLVRTPFLQGVLGLTDRAARALSPAFWPAPEQGELCALVGGAESAEFIRQNASIRVAWGLRAVPVCDVLPGLHHFDVLDALADPEHALHAHASRLLHA